MLIANISCDYVKTKAYAESLKNLLANMCLRSLGLIWRPGFKFEPCSENVEQRRFQNDRKNTDFSVQSTCHFLEYFEEAQSDFILRLLTHVGFLRQNGLILSEVFCIRKEARIKKKNIQYPCKKFAFLRRFDRKNTVLGISRNLINKLVFKWL